MIKKILYISLWVVILSGLVVTLAFVDKEHDAIVCPRLDISIDYSDGNYFLTPDDIRELIYQTGDSVKGQKLSDINLEYISGILKQDPFVEHVDVYTSINGVVTINVMQRKPLFRLINVMNKGCYMDVHGNLMPLSDKCASRVLVVNGAIYDSFYADKKTGNIISGQSGTVKILFALVQYIEQSDFWKAQISQIYITPQHEIELVPYVGDQVVMLGDTTQMVEKFNKLYEFYHHYEQTNFNKYKYINLKYKDQIVCTKN